MSNQKCRYCGCSSKDQCRAELYDEVWQKARDMGYGNVTDALVVLERMKATQLAAGEPVHQWADGILWQDSDETELASARAEGFKTRTLWTAPPAAAHEELPNLAGICRVADHPHGVLLILRSAPTEDDLRAIQQALRDGAAAHGDELVAVVGTVPDGSGFKSLDFKVELESLPDGTRLYAQGAGGAST